MSQKKYKYTKVGAVLKGENGPYIVLGNDRSKSAKYNYSVEMIVRDSEGNVLTTLKNGILSTSDPRKRPNITEEEASKISSKLMAEVFIAEKN